MMKLKNNFLLYMIIWI